MNNVCLLTVSVEDSGHYFLSISYIKIPMMTQDYDIPAQPKEVGAVITPFPGDLSPHGLRWG